MNNTELQKIADELEFDLEDVEMLIEVFIESAEESLKIMNLAVENNDYDSIFQSAHAIKGSAGSLTLLEIANLAKEIEVEARDSNNIDYKELYHQLNTLIQNIK